MMGGGDVNSNQKEKCKDQLQMHMKMVKLQEVLFSFTERKRKFRSHNTK